MKRIPGLPPIFSLVAMLALGPLWAQEPPPGRVSYVEGSAALTHPGEFDWLPVSVNLPVRDLDRFILQEDAFLEVEQEDGSYVRLGPYADAAFEKLSRSHLEIRLLVGDLILRSPGSSVQKVTTDSGVFRVLSRGIYRFSVQEDGGTRVAVRSGRLEVFTERGSRFLRDSEALVLREPADIRLGRTVAYAEDALDLWSDRRDAARAERSSVRHLGSTWYPGVSELDRYGSWSRVASYGWVWWPRVSHGWAPFRQGRWLFYPAWGWTWISFEPWGWLPYHSGRWVFVPSFSRWCWVPTRLGRWHPSTASFFWGSGWVGWAPLRLDQDPGPGVGGLGSPPTRLPRAAQPSWQSIPGLTVVSNEDFTRGRVPGQSQLRPGTIGGEVNAGLPPSLANPRLAELRQLDESRPEVPDVLSGRRSTRDSGSGIPAAFSRAPRLPSRSGVTAPQSEPAGPVQSTVPGGMRPLSRSPADSRLQDRPGVSAVIPRFGRPVEDRSAPTAPGGPEVTTRPSPSPSGIPGVAPRGTPTAPAVSPRAAPSRQISPRQASPRAAPSRQISPRQAAPAVTAPSAPRQPAIEAPRVRSRDGNRGAATRSPRNQ